MNSCAILKYSGRRDRVAQHWFGLQQVYVWKQLECKDRNAKVKDTNLRMLVLQLLSILLKRHSTFIWTGGLSKVLSERLGDITESGIVHWNCSGWAQRSIFTLLQPVVSLCVCYLMPVLWCCQVRWFIHRCSGIAWKGLRDWNLCLLSTSVWLPSAVRSTRWRSKTKQRPVHPVQLRFPGYTQEPVSPPLVLRTQ